MPGHQESCVTCRESYFFLTEYLIILTPRGQETTNNLKMSVSKKHKIRIYGKFGLAHYATSVKRPADDHELHIHT